MVRIVSPINHSDHFPQGLITPLNAFPWVINGERTSYKSIGCIQPMVFE